MSIIIKFPYKSTQKKYYQNAFSLFAFFAKNTYTSTTLASLAFCLAVSNFLFEYEMNIFFYYLFFVTKSKAIEMSFTNISILRF